MNKAPESSTALTETISSGNVAIEAIKKYIQVIGERIGKVLNRKNAKLEEFDILDFIEKRIEFENETRRRIHAEMDTFPEGSFRLTEISGLNRYIGVIFSNIDLFEKINESELIHEIKAMGEKILTSPEINYKKEMRTLEEKIWNTSGKGSFVESYEIGIFEILGILYQVYACENDKEYIEDLIFKYQPVTTHYVVSNNAEAAESRGDAISLLLGSTENAGQLCKTMMNILKLKYSQSALQKIASSKGDTNLEQNPVLTKSNFIKEKKYAKSHRFPEIRQIENIEIDMTKPLVIIGNTEANALSIARELDKQGKVNIVLRGGRTVFMQYKNGEVLYCEINEKEKRSWLLENCDYMMYPSRREEKIATPSNHLIEELLNDKNGVLKLFSEKYIPNPRMGKNRIWGNIKRDAKSGYMENTKEMYEIAMQSAKKALLKAIEYREPGKIVIKPSGASGGYKVRIFDIRGLQNDEEKFNEALKHVINIQFELKMDVIFEEYIEPLPLKIDNENVDWNLRVLVTRDQNSNIIIDDMCVRFGKKDTAVNICTGAGVMSYENLMTHLDLSPSMQDDLMMKISHVTKDAIMSIEQLAKVHYTSDRRARKWNAFIGKIPGIGMILKKEPLGWKEQEMNDFYGVDIIITKDEKDKPTPVIIELNGGQAGGIWMLDNVLPEEERGRPCRNLAKRIAQRAEKNRTKDTDNFMHILKRLDQALTEGKI